MKNFKKVLLTGTLTATAVIAMSITSKAATVKVTGDVLNIRKGPSTDTAVVAMISKGVECELIEQDGNWYKIKYKNYTGYVSKDYVKVIEEIPTKEENNSTEKENENQEKNNEEKTNQNDEKNKNEDNKQEEVEQSTYQKINTATDIKLLPLIHSSVIGNVKKNVEVLLISKTANWSYIATDTICGWVRNDTLGEIATKPQNNNVDKEEKESKENTFTEKKGYINEDLVNVRKGAGTSYNIIKVLTLNSEVTITGEEGSWYKVKSGKDEGYISKEFVSDSKKVTNRGTTTSRIENSEATTKTEVKTETSQKVDTNNVATTAKVEENNTTKTTTTNTTKTVEEAKTTNTETKATTTKTETKTSSIKGTDIVAYAQKYLGYKYVYGGDGSNGTFDCSGFTMYVYKHFGISIPHGATSQYKCGKGTKIKKQSDLQVGDIVLLTDYETGVGIGHCGIYLGNGNFIHASTTTYSVIISSLNTTYAGRFYAGLRLI